MSTMAAALWRALAFWGRVQYLFAARVRILGIGLLAQAMSPVPLSTEFLAATVKGLEILINTEAHEGANAAAAMLHANNPNNGSIYDKTPWALNNMFTWATKLFPVMTGNNVWSLMPTPGDPGKADDLTGQWVGAIAACAGSVAAGAPEGCISDVPAL